MALILLSSKAVPSHLGASPKIETREDVERAFTYLVHLADGRRAVQVQIDRARENVENAATAALQIQIDGNAVDVDEYAESIRKAIEAYTLNELAAGGEREFSFEGGKVSLRQNPAKIDYVTDRKTLIAAAAKKVGAVAAKLFKLIGLNASCWKLSPVPDLNKIKKAVADGQLTRSALKRMGFLYVDGADRVDVSFRGSDVFPKTAGTGVVSDSGEVAD